MILGVKCSALQSCCVYKSPDVVFVVIAVPFKTLLTTTTLLTLTLDRN